MISNRPSEYGGPGDLVLSEALPYLLLRVPVPYYRNPPPLPSQLRSRGTAALGRALGP